ncbi:MAG: hypothetical protein CM15mP77_1050 [Synechococcus sp.]|nr:MAG: hypothetical protein CM15mP77_1050 [Synechococcus sp.]
MTNQAQRFIELHSRMFPWVPIPPLPRHPSGAVGYSAGPEGCRCGLVAEDSSAVWPAKVSRPGAAGGC